MKTTIIVLILLLLVVPAAHAKYLYCSVPDRYYVWHFDVSAHMIDDFTNGGTTDKEYNYLDITNHVKIGPSSRAGYTEYRVMDVSFMGDIPYSIKVIQAYKRFDMRPAQNRYFFAHSGPSAALLTNQPGPDAAGDVIILEIR